MFKSLDSLRRIKDEVDETEFMAEQMKEGIKQMTGKDTRVKPTQLNPLRSVSHRSLNSNRTTLDPRDIKTLAEWNSPKADNPKLSENTSRLKFISSHTSGFNQTMNSFMEISHISQVANPQAFANRNVAAVKARC